MTRLDETTNEENHEGRMGGMNRRIGLQRTKDIMGHHGG